MEEIEVFCKHAGYLKVNRFRPLEEEYSSPRIKFIRMQPLFLEGSSGLRWIVEDQFENTFPPTLIHYYLAFRAYDRFLQNYGRAPGSVAAEYEKDLEEMISLAERILGELPANVEMVRYACAEM